MFSTKYTREVHKLIIDAIELGNYRTTAAAAAGICRNTLADWERRGIEGEAMYALLACEMQQAEARSEMALLAAVRNAESGDPWQSKAWMMERRFASRWSVKVKQTVAENVDALTTKLRANPELYKQVVAELESVEAGATH